eukprot:TRINITY_DN9573_c0_g1_i1.p1 TRINITY_DN9573_c0_g1~~TRINITY_DN9573_c0_g1_i1.p1  ORF type:complete len:424 (+),score=57.25 TRINITY_DN9573_c0_g1_i1:42-1313(+)
MEHSKAVECRVTTQAEQTKIGKKIRDTSLLCGIRLKFLSRWLFPLTLANPHFIAIKATVALIVAILSDLYITDNPDQVSSTFAALICISPSPLMGLKNSWDNGVGSAIGTFWGIVLQIIMYYGTENLPQYAAVGTAVFFSVYTCWMLNQIQTYATAGFSALYVVLIPYGTPWITLRVRVIALASGFLVAFILNFLDSFLFLNFAFKRRVTIVYCSVYSALGRALSQDKAGRKHTASAMEAEFGMISRLQDELGVARLELKYFRGFRGAAYDTMKLQSSLMDILKMLLECEILFVRLFADETVDFEGMNKKVVRDSLIEFIDGSKRGDLEFISSDELPEEFKAPYRRWAKSLELLEEKRLELKIHRKQTGSVHSDFLRLLRFKKPRTFKNKKNKENEKDEDLEAEDEVELQTKSKKKGVQEEKM